MHSQLGLLLLALGGVFAAPVETAVEAPIHALEDRDGDGTACIAHYKYTVSGEQVGLAAPHLVTGFRCTSLENTGCSLTHSATFTKTVTKTATAGLSGALDVADIFHVGADAGFNYSWATSKATGTSATVNCPAGEFECGLMAVATVVTTKGTVLKYWEGTNCLDQTNSHGTYTVVAPKTIQGVPADQAAIIDFKACLVQCSGDKCAEAAKIGLEKCPSS